MVGFGVRLNLMFALGVILWCCDLFSWFLLLFWVFRLCTCTSD